ncbi:MAG: PilZ domain-containing protein [Nitrospiraceae bacterium]|nr:MAG: PilZ domain-containing protein [Nitrospiraceae bacterium]
MFKQNCWEFKGCKRSPAGNGAKEEVCPAVEDASLSGINSGRNGGRICWTLAGTYAGGTAPGRYVKDTSSCINCDFFKLVEAEEGEQFEFFTADQLSHHDPYIYGTRQSMRFHLHLDIELRPVNMTTEYIAGVTSNVSRDGLSFVSENFKSAPHEVLEIRIRHPRNASPVALTGDMVWKRAVRDRCLAGVRIRDMGIPEKKDILNIAFEAFRKKMKGRQP